MLAQIARRRGHSIPSCKISIRFDSLATLAHRFLLLPPPSPPILSKFRFTCKIGRRNRRYARITFLQIYNIEMQLVNEGSAGPSPAGVSSVPASKWARSRSSNPTPVIAELRFRYPPPRSPTVSRDRGNWGLRYEYEYFSHAQATPGVRPAPPIANICGVLN